MNRGVSIAEVVEQEIVVEALVVAGKAPSSGVRASFPVLPDMGSIQDIPQQYSSRTGFWHEKAVEEPCLLETNDINPHTGLRDSVIVCIKEISVGMIRGMPPSLQDCLLPGILHSSMERA